MVTLGVVILIYLVARQIDQAAWGAMVIALVLAYLLAPMVAFFERRLVWIKDYEDRRTLSVVLTWLLVFGLFGLLVGLVVPATLVQTRAFANELPDLLSSTEDDLQAALSKPIHVGNTTIIPWDELQKAFVKKDGDTSSGSVTSTLQNWLVSLADSALGVVGGAVSFLFSAFFVLVMLFYLMRDGPAFAAYFVDAVPESYQGDVRRMMHELGLIWNAYLRGQLLLCLAVGGATYIVTLILGLPQPLLLAVLAGFLELIPNLGPTLSMIPAVLFAFTTSSTTFPALDAGVPFAAVVVLAYIGIQQTEAIFLVPRIMGRSLDLHPFVVLVSILIAANLVGVLGVILAAPTVATLRLFGRYLRGKLLDEEVFPVVTVYASHQHRFAYRVMRYFLSKRFPVQYDTPPLNSKR
jgi:predicted PurR-regulated permease PerM